MLLVTSSKVTTKPSPVTVQFTVSTKASGIYYFADCYLTLFFIYLLTISSNPSTQHLSHLWPHSKQRSRVVRDYDKQGLGIDDVHVSEEGQRVRERVESEKSKRTV